MPRSAVVYALVAAASAAIVIGLVGCTVELRHGRVVMEMDGMAIGR